MKEKFVTVFGSSIPKPGDREYEIAYHLGKKFAEANLNVCSGGFQGIMDAVSKAAYENGAKAIGVTLDIYNALPSKFLTEEIRCHALFERLEHLLRIGDSYVVLQGGTGTLVELALVWEFMNKKMFADKPVACHGNMWKEIVSIMEEQIKREGRKNGIVKCFNEIDELADYIIEALV